MALLITPMRRSMRDLLVTPLYACLATVRGDYERTPGVKVEI
jgi:hypothetical protein